MRMLQSIGVALSALSILAVAPSALAQDACTAITTRKVLLDGRNDEWVSADLKITPNDMVIVFANGEIVCGPNIGKVSAAGAGTVCKIQMKVGTGLVVPTGAQFTGRFDPGGSVKFRVFDTNYTDNAGTFEVTVVVIPWQIVPQPSVVQAE